MKTIILLRHGEAESPGKFEDHERPLTARGHSQAQFIGQALQSRGLIPDGVIVSDAKRTVETYKNVKDVMELNPRQEVVSSRFYLAGVDRIFEEMAAIEDDINTVLLIGHNPGWSEAIGVYTGEYESLGTGEAGLMNIEQGPWLELLGRSYQWQLKEKLGASITR
ncbi:SixA phosphatase family protein [Pseudobacteriovorax antillogorgiicola]|uniref:Phosphohistidine phosphatase n=1 Tax=Pseudobacteriovorax antillogorgiicola TaxID=1513793 RepID=A0A1Y6BUK8_9BACT|nr:histidine phosphatase family protein [Pseudobacteriovorax antillogorgiicola]TCS53804.1 phosphohistidine phosphatase [Pseudobacteriovorax antillogorgiicola]SMF22088.1 phosphohistidine phosphatase [Pseudobacteriovorax antillogorgiicola]